MRMKSTLYIAALAIAAACMVPNAWGMGSPSMYGWRAEAEVKPDAPPPSSALECPFQNDNTETVQLSPAHSGIFEAYDGSGVKLDVWYYRGDSAYVVLRLPNGERFWYEGEARTDQFPGSRRMVIPLTDPVSKVPAGEVLLCADPTSWREPLKDGEEGKEIVGSGCSVLSVGWRIWDEVHAPQLFMRTLSPARSTACYKRAEQT